MNPGLFDKVLIVQGRTFTTDIRYNTREGTWGDLFTVMAQVQDVLPSRADRVSDELSMTRRPARVRMQWRDDISQANRFKLGDRVLRIISGPAEIGRRETVEFMVEELSTAGEEP